MKKIRPSDYHALKTQVEKVRRSIPFSPGLRCEEPCPYNDGILYALAAEMESGQQVGANVYISMPEVQKVWRHDSLFRGFVEDKFLRAWRDMQEFALEQNDPIVGPADTKDPFEVFNFPENMFPPPKARK